MKRYLLFKCDRYYPSGGWGDFAGSFDSIAEARAFLSGNPLDGPGEVHLVDGETGTLEFEDDSSEWL